MKKTVFLVFVVFVIGVVTAVLIRDKEPGLTDQGVVIEAIDQSAAATVHPDHLPRERTATVVSGDAIKAMIGETLQDNKGNSAELELTDQKLVAFYFSASWCPPCRAFTPGLVSFYEQHQDELEVILVSSDNNAAGQLRYMESYNMPWKALEWRSREAATLAEKFNVEYIPTLVVMDTEGNVITQNGVREFSRSPKKAFADWQKRAGI